MLRLSEARVRIAMHYDSAYRDEIDDEVGQADEGSLAAETAWQAERQLQA